MPRPRKTFWRANITRRKRCVQGVVVETFDAYVRGPGERIYLSSFAMWIEARDACAHFLATGEKPESAKRGPRGPNQRNRKNVIKFRQHPAPKINRLEILRQVWRERMAS